MTQEVLIQVIFMLCNGTSISTIGFSPKAAANVVREQRIGCFEDFTNCAVGSDGKILDLKQFQTKCLRK